MTNDYDPIARTYDFLSRLVFGRAQRKSQTDMLRKIPPGDKILIVGGGTGWILDEIRQRSPGTCPEITYVEKSKRMIALSRERNFPASRIRYIRCAAEEFRTTERFDLIITAFLFDNFRQADAECLFDRLHGLLHEKGRWLYSDFYRQDVLWQKALLGLMYVLFRAACRVEARALPSVEPLFRKNGYLAIEEAGYFRNFIRSAVYTRPFQTTST